MAERSTDRPNSLVESHKGYDLRILFFYPAIALLLVVLIGGLAYQQLFKTDEYHQKERQQNQRRILTPGPRGNIYDREGRLLVKNRARFYAAINLDELRLEFRNEVIRVGRNYRDLDSRLMPTNAQIRRIARVSVVQRYMDEVNRLTGRSAKVDAANLERHFASQLLLPYVIADELTPEEYARLTEQVDVNSPIQLYATSAREYPYKNAAAHVLGYVLSHDELNEDDFPGSELVTLKMRGTIGKDGLEAQFNHVLQGKPGGAIYRVDPSGYRQETPIERRLPVQGGNVVTSIDIDLQMVAEKAIKDYDEEGSPQAGAAIAIDVRTGEVLAMVSAPDYDLNSFSPRLSSADAAQMTENSAWINRATSGIYPPGSTFKVLTSIAGLRQGLIDPATSHVDCHGSYMIGRRRFVCNNHNASPGIINLGTALEKSCNIFFYDVGLKLGPDAIAAEARRFHLDRRTGIELPNETRRMLVPDPAWLRRVRGEPWPAGETANYAIGQSALGLTPLQMACFIASVARGETFTQPTLVHDPEHPRQQTEPIGLSPSHYAALIEGMKRCIQSGTGRKLIQPPFNLQAAKIAGKTGTAQQDVYEAGQYKGRLNYAWFIGFAPYDNPEIAIAILLEGGAPGDEFGGGAYAAPVAGYIFKKYFEKKAARLSSPIGVSTAAN
jgi:Cell division protein FtsI/penicillin-binding protein 2